MSRDDYDISVWMPLFIGDFLRETAHLSTEERGAYLLLQMHFWVSAKGLPDDDARLANITGLPLDRWLAMREVLAPFYVIDDGRWRHESLQAEWMKAKGRREANQKRAKHAADARWKKNA